MYPLSLQARQILRIRTVNFMSKFPGVFSLGYNRRNGFCINREYLPLGFYFKDRRIGDSAQAWLIERDFKEEAVREIMEWLENNFEMDHSYVVSLPVCER